MKYSITPKELIQAKWEAEKQEKVLDCNPFREKDVEVSIRAYMDKCKENTELQKRVEGLELCLDIHITENKQYRNALEEIRPILELLAHPKSWFHILNYDGVDASKDPIDGWCVIGKRPDDEAQKALDKIDTALQDLATVSDKLSDNEEVCEHPETYIYENECAICGKKIKED